MVASQSSSFSQRSPFSRVLQSRRVLILLGLGCFVWLYVLAFRRGEPLLGSMSLFHSGSNGAASSSSASGATDRVTLVTIWAGLSVPSYLYMFLRSVEANQDRVDLLFIAKREDKPDGQCVDPGPLGPNIKLLCLSNDEYWDIHTDYLCEKWHCTPDQRIEAHKLIMHRGVEDYIHSHFRILRGSIFQKFFLNPATAFWGWCDTDVVLGSFNRNVPWDIAREYDFLQPSHYTEAKEILVYLRGHMTIFQNRQATEEKMLNFPAFRSFAEYRKPENKPVSAMEEEDFSTYLFHTAQDVTFLTFDSLVNFHFKAMSLSPHLYSLSLPGALDPTLPLPTPVSSTLPTFGDISEALVEGVVQLERGKTKEQLWIPLAKAVHYKAHKVKLEPGSMTPRRFLMRDSPGGPVRERVESWKRWEMTGPQHEIREGLYTHLQMEKKLPYFQMFPRNPLSKGRVLSLEGWDKASIREGRKIVWQWSKDDERLK